MSKILILTDILNTGGVSSFVTTLANGLMEMGHRVTMMVNKPGGRMEGELHPAVGLECLRPRLWHTRSMLTAMLRRRIIREKYQVVFFNNCYYVDSYCLRKTDATGVFVVHGDSAPELSRFLKEGLYCRHIVTVSPAVNRRFSHLKDVGYRVTMIPHGISLPGRPAAEAVAPFRVIYLGRISEEKGADMLAAIMPPLLNSHPDMVFTIVGNNEQDPAYQEQVLKDIRDRVGNPAQLVVETGLSGAAAKSKLEGMHVLIGPSRTEAFGLSFIEGAAYGVVPVISRIADVTEYIFEDGRQAMLIDPENADGFRDAVYYLCANREAWRDMSEEAYRHVSGHYSAEQMIAAYNQLLEMDLAGRHIVRTPEQKLFGIYRKFLLPDIRLMVLSR